MTQARKNLTGLGVVVVLVIAALVFFSHRHADTAFGPPTLNDLSGAGSQVPTAAALIADPSALRAAAKACVEDSGPDVTTLCDHVHSAEASLLAQKYRQGAAAH